MDIEITRGDKREASTSTPFRSTQTIRKGRAGQGKGRGERTGESAAGVGAAELIVA